MSLEPRASQSLRHAYAAGSLHAGALVAPAAPRGSAGPATQRLDPPAARGRAATVRWPRSRRLSTIRPTSAALRHPLRHQGQHRPRRRAHHRRLPGLRLHAGDIGAVVVAAADRRRRDPASARPTWTSSPPASTARARPTAPAATPSTRPTSRGGSSAGSAVAVALGVASFALGTDTAGSGRVPAPASTTSSG